MKKSQRHYVAIVSCLLLLAGGFWVGGCQKPTVSFEVQVENAGTSDLSDIEVTLNDAGLLNYEGLAAGAHSEVVRFVVKSAPRQVRASWLAAGVRHEDQQPVPRADDGENSGLILIALNQPPGHFVVSVD